MQVALNKQVRFGQLYQSYYIYILLLIPTAPTAPTRRRIIKNQSSHDYIYHFGDSGKYLDVSLWHHLQPECTDVSEAPRSRNNHE